MICMKHFALMILKGDQSQETPITETVKFKLLA
jgi:hypothetical protein